MKISRSKYQLNYVTLTANKIKKCHRARLAKKFYEKRAL